MSLHLKCNAEVLGLAGSLGTIHTQCGNASHKEGFAITVGRKSPATFGATPSPKAMPRTAITRSPDGFEVHTTSSYSVTEHP